jgi:heme A synthase
MRQVYRGLASLIALLVVVQAMTMVFADAGFFHWIDEGNSADPALFKQWEDNPPDFVGSVGFMIHGMSGLMVIPLVALLLLISSFFAKVPRGIVLALVVLLLVVVQVFAGIMAHEIPAVGLVHGLNAFLLFGTAVAAARAARDAATAPAAPAAVA